MNLLGFYLGLHDSNMCVVRSGKVRYKKFERNSGIKHERVDLRAVLDTCAEWDFIPDHVAYSDGGRNGLGTCDVNQLFRQEYRNLGFSSEHKTFCIDHHYAHILSAWPCLSHDVQPAKGIALDGRGDNNLRNRVVQFGPNGDAESLFSSNGFAVGRFFTLVGRNLGFEGLDIDFAGKVMGLQAYGNADLRFVASHIGAAEETLPHRLLSEIAWRGDIPDLTSNFFNVENPAFLDWLASCHLLLCGVVEKFFSNFCSPDDLIIYSGGCAQNTVFNHSLFQRFPKLIIPPHAYDGGLSLGCVAFLQQHLKMPRLELPAFPFIQDDQWLPSPSSETIEKVATILADGGIVGWMVGSGEVGPRALGHRSILFDPRCISAKDILNRKVKFRESWRPYAASVLQEVVAEWFDTARASPYMLEAIPVKDEKRKTIPGVTHMDGTCRIHTVANEPELTSFRELLIAFEAISGVPILLNTSLNLGGKPIAGTVHDAEQMLASGQLDALCIGANLKVKNASKTDR